jgi:hypothetical protein
MFACTTSDSTKRKNFYYTYGVDYIGGGENSFILRNILTQKLLVNNILSEESSYRLSIGTSNDNRYLSTSINKISTRVSLVTDVTVSLYDNNRKCNIMETKYKKGQTYTTVNSEASLSTNTANNDIALININNISELIIDDLLTLGPRDCLVKKKKLKCDKDKCNKVSTGMQLKKPNRTKDLE